ncbi:MAG: septum site-determining protein MinC [Anaerolineae bacterium]|nr:septum site-determining protein MinC [Thermoflexales bacterium]MDW8408225.1 septum site-determining protein MinC [Anaerolineae bacterium]
MVTIKGLRGGLQINFGDGLWLSQLRELETKLQSNARFFRGGQVALNLHRLSLSPDDLRKVQALLDRHGVSLRVVLAEDIHTAANAIALGLPTSLSESNGVISTQDKSLSEIASEDQRRKRVADYPTDAASDFGGRTDGVIAQMDASDGLLVRRRLRSGQVLQHSGHLVVLGDVNPGAQLIAGGDIIVWGKLSGSAHAGALGDTTATICALEFAPSLVRIADAARACRPSERTKKNTKPEMALIKDREIVIVAWQAK